MSWDNTCLVAEAPLTTTWTSTRRKELLLDCTSSILLISSYWIYCVSLFVKLTNFHKTSWATCTPDLSKLITNHPLEWCLVVRILQIHRSKIIHLFNSFVINLIFDVFIEPFDWTESVCCIQIFTPWFFYLLNICFVLITFFSDNFNFNLALSVGLIFSIFLRTLFNNFVI